MFKCSSNQIFKYQMSVRLNFCLVVPPEFLRSFFCLVGSWPKANRSGWWDSLFWLESWQKWQNWIQKEGEGSAMWLFCVFGAHWGMICAISCQCKGRVTSPLSKQKHKIVIQLNPYPSSWQGIFLKAQSFSKSSLVRGSDSQFFSCCDYLFPTAWSVHPGNEGAVQR